jgi:protein TonB
MFAHDHRDTNRDRVKSALAAASFHALLGYALVTGLAVRIATAPSEELQLFDVAEEPPPPLAEKPAPATAPKEEGAASPPNLEAKASPVVAPLPKVPVKPPPPVVAAPVPGAGSDRSAGASERPGPGSGSGGLGSGTGSGSGGSGTGGAIAERARLIGGRISDSDYPPAASRARAGGTVVARFTVGADGRPSGCTVIRSSGNAALDETTCRLIERRFRYRPARDAQGKAVADVAGWKQTWWLEPR